MDDLNALQIKHGSDAGKCFTAMLNLWLSSNKQPKLIDLIAALRERTVNLHAVAEELEILRENLRQHSGAAIESDILVSQDPVEVNNLSLPPTVSEAHDEKTRKRKQNREDTRDDAEEKVDRRENGQPIDTGGERKKQEMKYTYYMRTYIILITALVALLLAIVILSALTNNTCFVIVGGKGLKLAVEGERSFAILVNGDRNGQLCSTPMQIPTCWLESKISTNSINCTVTKLDDNLLEISYQATSQGSHQLHIKVEGEHIKGSPFTVLAKLPVQKLGTPIKTIGGLKKPWGVAVNQKGEIIVTENSAHCISIFSPTGEQLQSFGSKGSGPGQFNEPEGVTVDDDGNILVADTNNHRIQKFTSDNKHITSVGGCGSNHLQFKLPESAAISPITKKIAISEWHNNRVQILNPDLTFNSSIGSKGSGNGQLNQPHDTTFDSAGNMYVADASNDRIQIFSPEGQFLQQFGNKGQGNGELNFPSGISIDSDDTVYVVEAYNHCVSVFTREGEFLTSFGSQGYGPGQFNGPFRITMDKNGTIHVADSSNNRIQIFAKVVESPH